MAYNGSVELISGITQKNNGTFPLVDATAVRITDEKRLSDKITDIDESLNILEPPAGSSDVGKYLKVKSVSGGKTAVYEFGEGGATDYTDLSNKPQIEGVELTGDVSLDDLGIPTELIKVQDQTPTNPDTQIWLPETEPNGVQVPTYSELLTVKEDVNNLGLSVVNGAICITYEEVSA